MLNAVFLHFRKRLTYFKNKYNIGAYSILQKNYVGFYVVHKTKQYALQLKEVEDYGGQRGCWL